MRQPKWTLDEIVLAANAYFEIGNVRKITLDNLLVIELSKLLRILSIHKNTDAIFRNVAGVRMILFSIATLNKNAECPTCHKIAHTSPNLFQTINLKNAIKVGGGYHVQL